MGAVSAWIRWEMSRRIELTTGLRLIVIDRTVKAVALTIGGIALLVAERTGALATFASSVQEQLNLNPGSHLWLRLVNSLLQRFGALSHGAQVALAIAVLLYALLEAIEAIGVLARRRWAEYLVLLATVAFIPVELDEIVRHPTVLKGVTLLINVAIAVYLVWKKRLFMGRPQAQAAVMSPRATSVSN